MCVSHPTAERREEGREALRRGQLGTRDHATGAAQAVGRAQRAGSSHLAGRVDPGHCRPTSRREWVDN